MQQSRLGFSGTCDHTRHTNTQPLSASASMSTRPPATGGATAASVNVIHRTGGAATRSLERQYDNLCGICFTEIHPLDNPRGRLNSCNHLFCSYCIKQWAASTNVCPACKARFTRIYTKLVDADSEQETRVRRRNYKDWATEEMDHDSGDDESTNDTGADTRPNDSRHQERDRVRARTTENNTSSVRSSSNSDAHSSAVTVKCNVCQEGDNASRLIFCDRRECPFVAHLDCLCLVERPLTFLCSSCVLTRARLSDGVADRASAQGEDDPELSGSRGGSRSSNSLSDLMTPHTSAPHSLRSSCTSGNESEDINNSNSNNNITNITTSTNRNDDMSTTNIMDEAGVSESARERRMRTGASTQRSISAPAPAPYRKVAVTGSVHDWRMRVCASLPTCSTQSLPLSTVPTHTNTLPSSHICATTGTCSSTSANQTTADAEQIDLSRCNLTFPTPSPVLCSSQPASAELYFLRPTPHASAAMIELQRQREIRQHEADSRTERNAHKARRMQCAYRSLLQQQQHEQQQRYSPLSTASRSGSAYGSGYGQDGDFYYESQHPRGAVAMNESTTEDTLPPYHSPSPNPPRRGQKRQRAAAARDAEAIAEMQQRQLALEESEYTDPHRRQALEDRLTRQWAEDFIPTLRRNRDIAQNRLRLHDRLQIVYDAPLSQAEQAQRERALLDQAMTHAREVVRQKMEHAAMQIRQRREHMVKLRAAREAMALAKLARIIAAHRVSPSVCRTQSDDMPAVDESDADSVMSSVSHSRCNGRGERRNRKDGEGVRGCHPVVGSPNATNSRIRVPKMSSSSVRQETS